MRILALDKGPERWATVTEAPNYEISHTGKVRNRYTTLILRTCKHKSGHLYVHLGRKFHRQVHRLVLEAFVGPQPDGHESRHLDGNPTNNHIANLTWGTRKQNVYDLRALTGRFAQSKLTIQEAQEIRRKYTGQWGEKRRLARQYGVHESLIGRMLNGNTYPELGACAS